MSLCSLSGCRDTQLTT